MQLKVRDENSLTFIIDDNRTATFDTQTPEIHTALLAFVCEGKSLGELQNQDLDDSSLFRLFLFIDNLKKNGLVDYHFQFDNSENAIVYPKSHRFKDSILRPASFILKQCPYVLSRFSYFRREHDKMILECPLAPFRAVLNLGFANRLLPFITGEKKLIDYEYRSAQEEVTGRIFFNLLIESGVIHPIHEMEKEHLRFWEFHDLIFHSTSRRGEFDDNVRFGATYRFQKQLAAPQTFKDTNFDRAIKLYKPNLDELVVTDTPFSQVLENRRSVRNYSKSKKIHIKELGEFLYRSIGIREIIKTPKQDAIFRPYPGAGAIHEIDFYLVINACEGISPGIYYYQPMHHVLCRQNVDMQYIEKIILNAKAGMGTNSTAPQIVFVLTSRFKKIAWKYEKMSYRCTLISMGAIFQTMSLVATSMDLASCIVGSGDSSLFGEALAINSLEEGAVGEFALGIPSDEELNSSG